MLDRRITYRRRTSYKTRANHFKPVKTPGNTFSQFKFS